MVEPIVHGLEKSVTDMWVGLQVSRQQAILVPLVLEELFVVDDIAFEWEDQFKVALPKVFFLQVHQHLHFIFCQRFCAFQATLFSYLLIGHAGLERSQAVAFAVVLELGLVVASQSDAGQSIADKHGLDALVEGG